MPADVVEEQTFEAGRQRIGGELRVVMVGGRRVGRRPSLAAAREVLSAALVA